MPPAQRILLFVSFAILVVVLIGWHEQTTFHHGNQQQQPHAKDDTKNPQISPASDVNERLAQYTFWLTVFTAVLSVSTIGLWWTSNIHAGHADRAIISSERSAERQLRAYVFIARVELKQTDEYSHVIVPEAPITSGTFALSEVVITNFGQTPAYNVHIYLGIDMIEAPIRGTTIVPPLNFKIPVSRLDIGPGGETRIMRRLGRRLSHTDIVCLNDDIRAIIVHGEIRYEDTFGRPQTTKFRYFIGGPIGMSGIVMRPHEHGNEAT